jgi:hypothetical protein
MIFIDVLVDQYLKFPKYNRLISKKQINENSVNFLKYINICYNIKVTQLSKILNVSRQSIYNYFRIPTDQLPNIVIDKIIHIYGYDNFREVLNMELILFFKDYYEEEIYSEIEYGVNFNDIKHKYKYLFRFYLSSGRKYISLKDEFLSERFWKRKYAGLISHQNIDVDIYNLFRDFVSKHTPIYTSKLLGKINKLDKEDYEIIRILDNYLNSKRRKYVNR